MTSPSSSFSSSSSSCCSCSCCSCCSCSSFFFLFFFFFSFTWPHALFQLFAWKRNSLMNYNSRCRHLLTMQPTLASSALRRMSIRDCVLWTDKYLFLFLSFSLSFSIPLFLPFSLYFHCSMPLFYVHMLGFPFHSVFISLTWSSSYIIVPGSSSAQLSELTWRVALASRFVMSMWVEGLSLLVSFSFLWPLSIFLLFSAQQLCLCSIYIYIYIYIYACICSSLSTRSLSFLLLFFFPF